MNVNVGQIVLYRTGAADHMVVPMLVTEVHSDTNVSGVIFSANPQFHGIKPYMHATECVFGRRNVLRGSDPDQWDWLPWERNPQTAESESEE